MHSLVLVAVLVGLATAGAVGARRRASRPRRGAPLRPVTSGQGHSRSEHRRATDLVRRHAVDSLDPFALRQDKRYFFGNDSMLAYCLVGQTAVVAADPIGSAAAEVLERFLVYATSQGWNTVMTGVSARHLDACRKLKLRALHIGNEAVVDPRAFTLEGRGIRKVRQSVGRVARRGWSVEVVRARELGSVVMEELAVVEQRWQAQSARVAGFAMTLGGLCAPDEDPDGLYVLARDLDGRVRAFQHFVGYRDGLSLDISRRPGDEPNGLNEAMVVAVLAYARELALAEVSLNFAGFGHLMAPESELNVRQRLGRAGLCCVHGRFQLERLVHFNNKFLPTWRPRYLVYEHRSLLPLAALRVLQAEGYIRAPRRSALTKGWHPPPQPVAQSMTAAGTQTSR